MPTVGGVGVIRRRFDYLINLDENVVVDVDLAVHVGGVGKVKHDPHAGLLRIGQHRIGLECVARHGWKTRGADLAAIGHEDGLAAGR
jgi:hypothetical protein